MGNDQTKSLNPSDLENLEECTTFSREDIQKWYTTFRKECLSEQMSKQEFQVRPQKTCNPIIQENIYSRNRA